ncbi:MAG: response regulator [Candidatus Omnitrophota bacterium]
MNHKILVVDDEKEMVEVLSTTLKRAGYDVDTANNGREALGAYLESLHREPFSLMTLDIKMTGIDGLEVLEIIRKEEELRGIPLGKGIPIIMSTAFATPWPEAFKKGCDDYILKPYKMEDLLGKIEDKIK